MPDYTVGSGAKSSPDFLTGQAYIEEGNTIILEYTTVSNGLPDLGLAESPPPGEPVTNLAAEARGNWLDGCSYRNYTTRPSVPPLKVQQVHNSSIAEKDTVLPKTTDETGPAKSPHSLGSAPPGKSSIESTQGFTRLILTNTGSLTTKQLHLALRNALRLHPETYNGIQRVHKRLRKEISGAELSYIKLIETHILSRYRLTKWKAWRDRVIKPPRYPSANSTKSLNQLMTWNNNGIDSKFPVLKEILSKDKVAIAAIQEHLRPITHHIPGIRGYNLYERCKERGFWGHCLYVHQSLTSHEIQNPCINIIHVKVFGLSDDKPWHFLAI
ncbi:hypothetical protein VP01_18g7 [Puccinia sorghi]|uniref:Uncharacterized protein n=1 Tax=Puccinia sorghi TaxID=27349 RepID=A0A0L6VCS7_9BASI|nr:hypothetical protein VP01_18g7 [Puccinia sorghi]